jgi:hypothetical protein
MNENENLTPAPITDPATPTISEQTTPPAAPEKAVAVDTITAPPVPAPAPEVIDPTPRLNILTRLVRAIDRALASDTKRTGHALIIHMILDTEGGQETFIGKSDLDTLRAWQARYDRNLNFMLNARPDTDWLNHQKDVRDGIESEITGDLHAMSRDEFTKAHMERVEAARLNLEAIYQECFPLCSAIAYLAIEIAEKKVRGREKREREECAYYGVTNAGPSAIVQSWRAAIQFARMRSTFVQNGRAAPRDIIGYINF